MGGPRARDGGRVDGYAGASLLGSSASLAIAPFPAVHLDGSGHGTVPVSGL